jgi:LysR family glycine cleavage system transcriptional activator
MDWREIPSLSALRAFEAAARTMSLSAAARELNVTHAAIASHVRTLEARFGGKLLLREGQRMMPTPGGSALAEALTDAFAQIARGVEALDDERRARPLRVTLTPSFAAHWLMPRMARFWTDHPQVDVELLPSTRSFDMEREGIDLAIRYGKGDWPGLVSHPFLVKQLVAVARPGVVAPGKLAEATFLLDRLSHDEARLWLEARGIDLDDMHVRHFESIELCREAALAGLGLSLLPRIFLGDAVASGRLVIHDEGDVGQFGYHLVQRAGPAPSALALFTDWLRAEVAAG